MFSPRQVLVFAVAVFAPVAATAADPPAKPDRYVAPLKVLIEILKDGDRAEQHTAAKHIRNYYPGDKCLEALPQLVATQGQELARPYDAPDAGLGLERMIAEAVQTAGPKRFKLLFEMTTNKDPLVRAGAFNLLCTGSDYYQKAYYDSKEKSELDLEELLKAAKKGAKDDSPLVRGQVMISLRALSDADEKISVPAAELLATALEDREEIKNKLHDTPAYQAACTLVAFKAKAKPAVNALLKAVEKEDGCVGGEGYRALGRVAKDDSHVAEQAIKLFREKLSDTKRADGVRMSAAWGLVEMGRAAKPAIPDLAALLDEPKLARKVRYFVYESLEKLGPNSEEATLVLVARLEKATERDEQWAILGVLAAIGPPAEKAVKPLEEWAKTISDKDDRLQQAVTTTLARIR